LLFKQPESTLTALHISEKGKRQTLNKGFAPIEKRYQYFSGIKNLSDIAEVATTFVC
jgi:hypothetical protein